MAPQETLSPQLDAGREEGEYGKRVSASAAASAEQPDIGLTPASLVEDHCLLLAGHGILRAGIFVVDGLDVRTEHTHESLALVTLVGEREEHELDENGQQQDDDSIVGDEFAEEIEHGESPRRY